MELDYSIEEMLLQSPNLVVYKARGRNGFRYAISRFIFSKSILANLTEECFNAALKELKSLSHGCLRPVIDGGLDEVDGMPWVARVWWDGEYLDDRINDGVLTPHDIQRLVDHGQALIDALGDRASAISFRARDVILASGRGGQSVETFNIDVQKWLIDWAMGMSPGGGKNARTELSNLVTIAENSEMLPMIQQEEEPVVRFRQLVTSPPPTQQLVPSPPPTRLLTPAPPPTQLLIPQPTPSQNLIPAPTPSQHLVQPAQQPYPAAANQPMIPQPTPSQQLVQSPPQGYPSPYPVAANQSGVPAPTPSQLLVQSPQSGQPLIPLPVANDPAVPPPSPSQFLVQSPQQAQAEEAATVPMVANKLIFENPGQAKRFNF